MADKELSELDAAGTLDGTETLYLVDGDGNSRRVTLADLKTFVNTDPTVVPSSEPWRGARVYRTSNATGLASGTVITWQAEAVDTDGFWSAGAPTRLTIPAGITKVRLKASLNCELLNTAGTVLILLLKNGSGFTTPDHLAYTATRNGTTGIGNNPAMVWTPVLDVTPGDYFEVQFSFTMAGMDTVFGNSQATWFEVEVVEASV